MVALPSSATRPPMSTTTSSWWGFREVYTCKEEGGSPTASRAAPPATEGQPELVPPTGTRYLAAKPPREDGDAYLALHVQRISGKRLRSGLCNRRVDLVRQ